MKTTIELPDDLAREVKSLAAKVGIPMRSLVEEALRRELARHLKKNEWVPTDAFAVSGELTDEARTMSWSQVREASRRDAHGLST